MNEWAPVQREAFCLCDTIGPLHTSTTCIVVYLSFIKLFCFYTLACIYQTTVERPVDGDMFYSGMRLLSSALKLSLKLKGLNIFYLKWNASELITFHRHFFFQSKKALAVCLFFQHNSCVEQCSVHSCSIHLKSSSQLCMFLQMT